MSLKMKAAAVAIYVALSLLLSIHYFRTPLGAVDMLDFAGCVTSSWSLDPVVIHDVAYREILRDAPVIVIPHILGTDGEAKTAAARQDRHANPYHFVEALPYFSVKPLYIELISILYGLGIRMVPAIVLASVVPAFGVTLLMCGWALRLQASVFLLCGFLLVPEIRVLGQSQGPDALSTFALLGSFMFIFAGGRLSPGIALLLISIWIRPDNVIVALLVIAYLGLRAQLPPWAAAVFAVIAFASPMVINHYGGYGWKALYSHTFKYVEMAPGEFSPTFTSVDYVHALRRGLVDILDSSSVAYFVLGVIAYKTVPQVRSPLILTVAASAMRFALFPNFEPRYFGISYVLVAVASAVSLSRIAHRTSNAR